MREFWNDYYKLCKDSGRFMKKHWKGAIVLNAAVIGAEFAWFFRDQIKDSLKEKFHKEDEAQ